MGCFHSKPAYTGEKSPSFVLGLPKRFPRRTRGKNLQYDPETDKERPKEATQTDAREQRSNVRQAARTDTSAEKERNSQSNLDKESPKHSDHTNNGNVVQTSGPVRKRPRRSRRGGVRNARRRENRERRQREAAMAEAAACQTLCLDAQLPVKEVTASGKSQREDTHAGALDVRVGQSYERGKQCAPRVMETITSLGDDEKEEGKLVPPSSILNHTEPFVTQPVLWGISGSVPTYPRAMRKNELGCVRGMVERRDSSRGTAIESNNISGANISIFPAKASQSVLGRGPTKLSPEAIDVVNDLEGGASTGGHAQASRPFKDQASKIKSIPWPETAVEQAHTPFNVGNELQRCLESCSLWDEWHAIMRRNSFLSDDFDLFQRRRSRMSEDGALQIKQMSGLQ